MIFCQLLFIGVVMPLFLGFSLYQVTPTEISNTFIEPSNWAILCSASIMLYIGSLIIKKIVDSES